MAETGQLSLATAAISSASAGAGASMACATPSSVMENTSGQVLAHKPQPMHRSLTKYLIHALLSREGCPGQFRMRPSVDRVTTCEGTVLPLRRMASIAARSIPPQQGTSMRTTVRLLISLRAMISVSLSE